MGVLCYRSQHGALPEGKLLKSQLAGKHYNLHIKRCWQENPPCLVCESFHLLHIATTPCYLFRGSNGLQFQPQRRLLPHTRPSTLSTLPCVRLLFDFIGLLLLAQ